MKLERAQALTIMRRVSSRVELSTESCQDLMEEIATEDGRRDVAKRVERYRRISGLVAWRRSKIEYMLWRCAKGGDATGAAMLLGFVVKRKP